MTSTPMSCLRNVSNIGREKEKDQELNAMAPSTSQSLTNETSTSSTTTTKAFFIFGDSTVDSGNNNYIDTIPENKANYKPYGQNGFFENPRDDSQMAVSL
ncbi:GDSL esterase/lipase 2 [Spatholobus suberectus]|nr:GDSL esterase/lipase 2 [Spatholobus suberectus]